jgi:hypothetical protein
MKVRVRLRGGVTVEGDLYGAHPHRSTRPDHRNEQVCVYYVLPHGLTPGSEVYIGCASSHSRTWCPSVHVLGIEVIT